MLYFPSHKVEVKTICMPVSYCFMKARGGLAQSNNLMETLRDFAHFVSQPCFSLSFPVFPHISASSISASASCCWNLLVLLFVLICFFSHVCFHLPFLPLPSSPHFSDCYFLELGIRDGISEMVYNFHVISPVSKAERRVESMKKTVPRIGLSVYKGSNEKNSSKLKVLQSFTWTLESLPERHTWGWSHGKKNRERFNPYDDRNYWFKVGKWDKPTCLFKGSSRWVEENGCGGRMIGGRYGLPWWLRW